MRRGGRTRDELLADLGLSFGRLASSSGGAFAGAGIGAAIGTAVFPLVGSIIGGTFGTLVGAASSGRAARWAVNQFKWSNSIRAFELLEDRYGDRFSQALEKRIAAGFLGIEHVSNTLSEEKSRIREFKDELERTSGPAPSLAAVLVEQTVHRLEHTSRAAEAAARRVHDRLTELCIQLGLRRFPRERRPAQRESKRYFGSFLAESAVLRPALREDEVATAGNALRELSRYPAHPYRLSQSKDEILCAIAMALLVEEGEKP